MKKVLSLCLVGLMLVLAACGNGNNASSNTANNATTPATPANTSTETPATEAEEEEITPEEGAKLVVWESQDQRPFVEAIIKEFTDKYGIEVVFEEVGSPEQANRLNTDGAAGLGADVVVMAHDNLGKSVEAGLVLPNDFYEQETRDENMQIAVDAVTYDGVLYGYPKSVETYALFYNKDIIATPPTTFDEVVEFAQGYNDVANNKYALMWEVGNFYFSYPFVAAGGYVFGDNGRDASDIGLNNEGAIAGLTYYGSLKDKILPMNSGDVTYDIKMGFFTGGTLAMDINGPWTIAQYRDAGINFGVAPIPAINGQPAKSFSGVKAWYVNSFSQYPNAARLFARFASTKEAQVLQYEKLGSLPSNIEAGNDPLIQQDEVTQGFLAQFANSEPMPSIPEMGNVWSPIAAAFSDVWNSGKDAKEALDNAVQQIKDANANIGK